MHRTHVCTCTEHLYLRRPGVIEQRNSKLRLSDYLGFPHLLRYLPGIVLHLSSDILLLVTWHTCCQCSDSIIILLIVRENPQHLLAYSFTNLNNWHSPSQNVHFGVAYEYFVDWGYMRRIHHQKRLFHVWIVTEYMIQTTTFGILYRMLSPLRKYKESFTIDAGIYLSQREKTK